MILWNLIPRLLPRLLGLTVVRSNPAILFSFLLRLSFHLSIIQSHHRVTVCLSFSWFSFALFFCIFSFLSFFGRWNISGWLKGNSVPSSSSNYTIISGAPKTHTYTRAHIHTNIAWMTHSQINTVACHYDIVALSLSEFQGYFISSFHEANAVNSGDRRILTNFIIRSLNLCYISV